MTDEADGGKGGDAWRVPNPYERRLLAKMLEVDFQGRDELRAQWRSAKVRTLDEHGCLEICADASAPPCRGDYRIPVEGEWLDDGTGGYHALLHLDGAGFITELEFYSDSGMAGRAEPDPLTMDVFAPSGVPRP